LAHEIGASPLRRRGTVALVAVCAFGLLPNIRELTYGADYFREQSEDNRAAMGAADLLGGHGAASTPLETETDRAAGDIPDLDLSLEQYLADKQRFGTPAFSLQQIEAAEPAARSVVDRLISRALSIELRPAVRPPRPLPTQPNAQQTGGVLTMVGGCMRFVPLVAGAQVTLPLPAGGIWVRPRTGSAVQIGLERFAEDFGIPIGPALGGRASALRLPPGPASKGWRAQLVVEQPLLVCGA
jgi:hypothetical protein